jgi:hypothetical protein
MEQKAAQTYLLHKTSEAPQESRGSGPAAIHKGNSNSQVPLYQMHQLKNIAVPSKKGNLAKYGNHSSHSHCCWHSQQHSCYLRMDRTSSQATKEERRKIGTFQ